MAEKRNEIVARWTRWLWWYEGERETKEWQILLIHVQQMLLSLCLHALFLPVSSLLFAGRRTRLNHTSFFLCARSLPLFTHTHAKSSQNIGVCPLFHPSFCVFEWRASCTHSSSLLSLHYCTLLLTLSTLLCCHLLSQHLYSPQLFTNECKKQTPTHLRGPPSSYGGMMTTLTVTDVLSRSIICSWVSVTAATLQISTNRLPCLSPACQAKPYSSTCKRIKKHNKSIQTCQLCAAKILHRWVFQSFSRDLVQQMVIWQYLGHSAVQTNMEAQLSQSVSPQSHIHRLTSHCQWLEKERKLY